MLDFTKWDVMMVEAISALVGVSADSIIFPVVRLLTISIVCCAIYFGVKSTFIAIVRKMIQKRGWRFGSYLIKHNLFTNTLKLVPVAVVLQMADRVGNNVLGSIMTVFGELAMVVLMGMLVMNVTNAGVDILAHRKQNNRLPIKSFAQVVNILVVITCFITGLAKISGQSPTVFLSGLGAITAWLMLLFKDTLLGIVAGVQIGAYQMMKVGDWVEIRSLGVDGEVLDISLNTIKFRSWDNSILMIPAYQVLNQSVVNWTEMFQSGRRIKESIFIDSSSIRFLTDEEMIKLKEVNVLKLYLGTKEHVVKEVNKKLPQNEFTRINGRGLTNIGTFREYVSAYLKNHPEIAKSQTLLVRKLSTGNTGVPMELYCFTKKTGWFDHEQIKADIFDHLYAALPLFGLRQYQSPSSGDIQKIGINPIFQEDIKIKA